MARERRKTRYIKQLLFILIVISCAILFFLIQEKKDYTEYILKLDSAIKDTLVKNNIKDKDIIHQYWKEKKQGFQSWIEITKEIEIPEYVQQDKLRKSLVESVKKFNPDIYLGENIEIGKDKKTFIKIVFLKKKLKVAIVIDDLGYEEESIENFLSLNIPINFSVLPKEKHTKQIIEKFQKLNIPYLLHLPLEPHNIKKNYPGKAALLLSMSDEEIEKMFESNLKSVGSPVGVNNHMGSKFSEDEEKMAVLFNLVKKYGLFYLDSSTSKKS
ncbi:MAG: divergent polysaccharide deacetylase family protein, partial [Endomicrobiia bacterium]